MRVCATADLFILSTETHVTGPLVFGSSVDMVRECTELAAHELTFRQPIDIDCHDCLTRLTLRAKPYLCLLGSPEYIVVARAFVNCGLLVL